MNQFSTKDRRLVGTLTILSGILALASMLVGLIATNFDPQAFSDPVRILDMEGTTPASIRWFMLLDMFGYYLFLLPVIFYAHQKMKGITPWASFISAAGYGYVIIGALGAAMLSAAWPSLMIDYRQATADTREIYKALFLLSNDLVVKGVWNTLEVLLSGMWWIGIGITIIESRALKTLTVVLGAACLADGAGETFDLTVVAEIGLNIYLVLAIVWAVWMGVSVLRVKR